VNHGDLLVLGCTVGFGFTVALFFATAAFLEACGWTRPKWVPF